MNGYQIDVHEQTLREVDCPDWRVMQRFCGGHFELAREFRNKDRLYVDGEAYLKPPQPCFLFEGMDQIFVGNALYLGRETGTKVEKIWPPKSSIFEIAAKVKFLTCAEARALADSRPNGFGPALASR